MLCKSLGSPNHINVARATINGLASLRRPDEIARLRGLAPDEFLPAALWQAYRESEGAAEAAAAALAAKAAETTAAGEGAGSRPGDAPAAKVS